MPPTLDASPLNPTPPAAPQWPRRPGRWPGLLALTGTAAHRPSPHRKLCRTFVTYCAHANPLRIRPRAARTHFAVPVQPRVEKPGTWVRHDPWHHRVPAQTKRPVAAHPARRLSHRDWDSHREPGGCRRLALRRPTERDHRTCRSPTAQPAVRGPERHRRAGPGGQPPAEHRLRSGPPHHPDAADLYTTGPIRFTSVARAVADAARGMARFIDVQALVSEAVQRGSCTLEQLAAELREGPAAGRRWYRMAVRGVGAGIRAVAQAQVKYLLDRSDLERPMYNADLFTPDGVFLGRPDAWFGRAGVAGEVDSREYHLAGLRGDHPAP